MLKTVSKSDLSTFRADGHGDKVIIVELLVFDNTRFIRGMNYKFKQRIESKADLTEIWDTGHSTLMPSY